jgi:putative methionine-R-sulfoxide reductase with GAF domain
MLLGPRRDKPACSPIGLHGACGRSLLSGRALVVTDVATLGEGYIACDPRDRSEVVLPLLSPDGTAWGVLDADSYQVGAFTRDDAASLSTLVRCAGLCAGSGPLPVDTV